MLVAVGAKHGPRWVGDVEGMDVGFSYTMTECRGLDSEKPVAEVAQTGDNVTGACQQIKFAHNRGAVTNFFSSSPWRACQRRKLRSGIKPRGGVVPGQ